MARALLVVLLVLAALVGPAAPAVSAAEWCDTDPVLLIETPDGTLLTLYLLVGALGAEHLPATLAASLLAAAEPLEATGGGALRVTVAVTVPDDAFARGFPTRALVSGGPLGTGTVHATTEGASGAPMTLRFTLPRP